MSSTRTEYTVGDGDAVIVQPVRRTMSSTLQQPKRSKLYTIYAPPHHKDGVVRATKAEAEADGPEFDGATTE